MCPPRSLLTCCLLSLSAIAHGGDWPQWLGPQRDGVWRERGIVESLPADGPRVTWRANVGGGYAGPSVADGRVFVSDFLTDADQSPDPDQRSQVRGTERLLCLAEADGKRLWKYEYPCTYNISYPVGPRATPTVDGPRVYLLGAEGDLACLHVDNGEVLWSRNLKADYHTKAPMWGFAGHPLVDGNRLICLVGGSGSAAVAFDKMTGAEIWQALDTPDIGYSPPTLIEAGGKRQLLIWHATALNSLDPESGQVYWSQPLKPDYGMSIVPPQKADDLLFVGAIKDKSMLLRLAPDRPAAEVVWVGNRKRGIGPSHSPTFVDRDDPEHMYGVDRGGDLCCVKLDTGQKLWATFALMQSKRRTDAGTAFLCKNDDRFFIASETGELIMAQLSPQGYDEISRSKALLETTHNAFGRPVVWSPPAFANGGMFWRNDKELIRVSLAADEGASPAAGAK